MAKPDFIIIGAMKSATSTLHSQLALQQGIFMTTPKEPNYFSDDEQYALGDVWYNGLFDDAGKNDLCGESSTHYTKLPYYPHALDRMVNHSINPKLIYVMRHPIDRLVSHYIHQWSQNIFKCDINQAIDQYEELTAYSRYAMQLEPYFKQFGSKNVLPIFTEAIRIDPQKQLEKVAKFIGNKSAVHWHSEEGAQNVSKNRVRRFPGYEFLIDSKLMTYLRQSLVPQSVRSKIKDKLSMQIRPEVNEKHLKQLTLIFDKDMDTLSEWLGLELNCENYHDMVTKY